MFASIIIPTINGEEYLKKSLDSLYLQQAISNFEVIVIDNGSISNSQNFIKQRYSNFSLIVNQKNMGSSFARNQGLALAKGDYILFMDCDVELEEGFLSSLISILRDTPEDIAGISPKIIDKESGKIFSCGLFISSIYRVYDIGKGKSPEEYSQALPIDGPNSCCAVFRRSYLEKIKRTDYFDNDFFFLFEDADLALRLKKRDYKCLYTPELTCYHQKGSSGISLEKRRYLCFRNRLYMIFNNNNFIETLNIFAKSFIYDLFRTLHLLLTNKYGFRIFSDLIKKHKNEKHSNSQR